MQMCGASSYRTRELANDGNAARASKPKEATAEALGGDNKGWGTRCIHRRLYMQRLGSLAWPKL